MYIIWNVNQLKKKRLYVGVLDMKSSFQQNNDVLMLRYKIKEDGCSWQFLGREFLVHKRDSHTI